MTSVKSVDNAETAVLAAAKDMLRRGLVEGTAGNISARRSDGNIVVTPSSVDYADMELEDLVLVDPEGAVLQAKDGRIAVVGSEAAPGVLQGVRRHRQRHPQSSRLGDHVRHRASADSGLHRRVRGLLRRRRSLRRVRRVRHTRCRDQCGQGPGRPRRRPDRQPRPGRRRAPPRQGPAHHRAGGTHRPNRLGRTSSRWAGARPRRGEPQLREWSTAICAPTPCDEPGPGWSRESWRA